MSRQAFEEWVGKGLHLERIPTGAPFAGDYRNIVMQTRWDAWQAATAAALERAAQACEDASQEYEPYTGQPRGLQHTCAAAIRALKDER